LSLLVGAVAQQPANWTELHAACKYSGSYTLPGTAFSMDGYDGSAEGKGVIHLDDNQTITIIGNGAVLDASKKGSFFFVASGSLTLESITLQHANIPGVSRSWREHGQLSSPSR
jgi:hypothetical protein